MKKIFILILALLLCFSCKKYHDPAFETLDSYYFGFQNTSGKRYLAGDYVDDSLIFYVMQQNGQAYIDAEVRFEVLTGGGTLSVNDMKTDNRGYASTVWQLGNESTIQTFRAKVYDTDGNYLSYSDLYEYAFRKNHWDEISEYPDGSIMDMASDTIDHVTLMVSEGNIYRQEDKYYLWQQITLPGYFNVTSVDVDSNGVFYLGTWDGNLMKSIDGGNTWLPCTKPYPELSQSVHAYVANDNSVWVFENSYPTKYSYDDGMTWNIAGSDLSQWGYGDIFRMKDGSLFFHGSNCCSLNRSTDDGATWSHVATPGLSLKMYADDSDNIFIITQENGLSIYMSSDYGITFNKVYTVTPLWGTDMRNTFNKWHGTYYIIIPGYGILKSDDLTHYSIFWTNDNIYDMFIDDKGTIIAKDWNMHTVYYYSADPQ